MLFKGLSVSILSLSLLAAAGPVSAQDLAALEKAYVELAAKVRPSVVSITVDLARGLGADEGRLFLSGVVMDREGRVVTLDPGIEDPAGIEVLFHDGVISGASVVGADKSTGIVVLKVDRKEGLVPMLPADPSGVRIGSLVVAVGNPFGLSGSVSFGNVSGLGRLIDRNVSTGMIQFTAPVNPGDQGGLLADSQGRMIGLISSTYRRAVHTVSPDDLIRMARKHFGEIGKRLVEGLEGEDPHNKGRVKVSGLDKLRISVPFGEGDGGPGSLLGTHGLSFAMPAEFVRPIFDSIVSGKPIVRGWLGVRAEPIRRKANDPSGPVWGVVVKEILKGSPAEKARLRRKDVLLSFDHRQIRDLLDFKRLVTGAAVGKEFDIELLRGGKKIVLQVILEEMK